VQEALLAFWLERRFGKDQILTIYLNRVYFGQGAYGVDAAARRYFGKPAQEVSVYESAMLAGLLKAPSRYNPASNPRLAEDRAGVVLDSMIAAGWLTPLEAERARAGAVVVRGAGSGAQSRYAADWVLERARGYVGHKGGDLVVVTTIDPRLQRLAEQAVARNLAAAGDRKAGQAALVAMRPDGAVVAMVGGRSYAESQFNRATQALRQPGSEAVRLPCGDGGRPAPRRHDRGQASHCRGLDAAQCEARASWRCLDSRGGGTFAELGRGHRLGRGRPWECGGGGAATRHHQRTAHRPGARVGRL
jgi:membrane peptidoglycan carboxypeptidase